MYTALEPLTRAPRILLAVALALAAPGCGNSTGPGTTYTLVAVNNAPLPVSMPPGSPVLVQGATLTLGPGRRAVHVIDFGCASPLPPGPTCSQGPVRVEGTYAREAGAATGTVTFGGKTNGADFLADGVIIHFSDPNQPAAPTENWSYRR